eukprot:6214195-Pleurochrysis_carterae.AAC.8
MASGVNMLVDARVLFDSSAAHACATLCKKNEELLSSTRLTHSVWRTRAVGLRHTAQHMHTVPRARDVLPTSFISRGRYAWRMLAAS